MVGRVRAPNNLAATKETVYTDSYGNKTKVVIPADAPDSDAPKGIVIGPPDLDSLGLPRSIEVRLNNELFARGLLRRADVMKRPQEVFAALQAALRVDVAAVTNLYES